MGAVQPQPSLDTSALDDAAWGHLERVALVVREYDDALLRFTLEGKADAPSTFVYAYAIVFGAERERASELVTAASSAISTSSRS